MRPTAQQLVARLRQAAAFAELSADCLQAVAELATFAPFRAGQEILAKGTRPSGFYILLSGRVTMCRSLPDGRTLTLALFGPGDLFGTVSALAGQACDASMVAHAPSLCAAVRREDLFALLRRRPELLGELLPALTQRLAECTNCIVELSCYRVERRLAGLLLKLAGSVGVEQATGTLVPIAFSRQELADMTGTTIETCIRIMSRWAKAAMVETRKDGFLIRDRTRLGELAAP